MVHLRINERIRWCAPHGFEACDFELGARAHGGAGPPFPET